MRLPTNTAERAFQTGLLLMLVLVVLVVVVVVLILRARKVAVVAMVVVPEGQQPLCLAKTL